VTEELLAKVVFDQIPESLPSVGELTEVTVALAPLPTGPAVPNAAIQRIDCKIGVWRIINDRLHFTPGTLGAHSSVDVVEHIPGITP
jgi:hypothetical protein